MKSAQLRILLIAGTILLSVALYFLPSQINKKGVEPRAAAERTEDEFNPEDLLRSAKAALDSNSLQALEVIEKASSQSNNKDTALLDSIGRIWDRNGIPAASAIWFERKAEIVKSEASFLDAAYRYFDSFRMAKDSTVQSLLVGKAITNYEKVLEINPNNLNAKTDLGACYADGTSEPMKGIMLLRDVVTADPNHEMAQYNLGMLSVKSGQLDKAIERFQKVLEINPERTEMNFYLGQVHLQKGDTAAAIQAYETFIKNAKYDVSDVIKMVQALKSKSS
ncbi:MAG: tetratricopeptide repeat protein [Bacteroidetes bacterium]|nr:tetratricopeptide repeat protein [Bacteroidota bacterium]